MSLQIKRIYEPPLPGDGYRVLVDRLWPRGVSKEKAALGIWLKDIGPSNELRQWFGHQPERFNEFAARYQKELQANPVLDELKQILHDHNTVTLLYSAHDDAHNQAVVLQKYFEKK